MCDRPAPNWAIDALRSAGCVAAEDEALELQGAAASEVELEVLVARRSTGEPLAWITGRTTFCGATLCVHTGVFVPRWQSEPLARAAVALLHEGGLAVDLCTGAGAVAAVLQAARPQSTVLATELHPGAVACARANGVRVYQGDLFAALPPSARGRVDVLTAVAPYVPRFDLPLLPHDVVAFEPIVALDGGVDGLDVVRRIVAGAPDWLRTGGHVLLEVGMDQCDTLEQMLAAAGFVSIDRLVDDDGDPRGVRARLWT